VPHSTSELVAPQIVARCIRERLITTRLFPRSGASEARLWRFDKLEWRPLVPIVSSSFERGVFRGSCLRVTAREINGKNKTQILARSRADLMAGACRSIRRIERHFVFVWAVKIKIYRTIILPVVLYGCETWSLTLREKRGLRAFEKRVLRRIFGPKRDEVTGEWRKLHNEELNNLYSSPNIVRVINSRRMRWAGHVARMGEGRCTGFWWGNLREGDHWGDPGVDGRKILGWIFGKWDVGVWTGWS